MKTIALAFTLAGQDNNSYMLGGETRKALTEEEREFYEWRFTLNGQQHPATCKKCGRKTDRAYVSPCFDLRKKRLDFSATYDGYTIVSGRFKACCETLNLEGLEFIAIPTQPKHFVLIVNNVLEIDPVGSEGIRQVSYCDQCGKYCGVFGIAGLRLKQVREPIANGIFRTDLEFAQAHEQHPVLIVGTDVAQVIRMNKFKGVCLTSLEAAEPSLNS